MRSVCTRTIYKTATASRLYTRILTRNTIELYPTIFKILIGIDNEWRISIKSNKYYRPLAKNKKLLKKLDCEFALIVQWSSARGAIGTTHSMVMYFTIECSVSIAPLAEDHCTITAVLPYCFNNYFIFSQWPLIFVIIKFNTSLYRFLLKFLKIVRYSSIVFLVSVIFSKMLIQNVLYVLDISVL